MPTIIQSSNSPDANGYFTHTLDAPYDGYAHTNNCSIQLNGQQTFQLAAPAGDIRFSSELPAEHPNIPPVILPNTHKKPE